MYKLPFVVVVATTLTGFTFVFNYRIIILNNNNNNSLAVIHTRTMASRCPIDPVEDITSLTTLRWFGGTSAMQST